jgi:tetratricopeptide (TPR) repeat protein
MPTVVNGVGTWYYGKQQVFRIRGQCEFCNRINTLESYNTTLYFVVVFVPIIPLSKKRILNNCPACQQHRVSSLKDWEKAKTEAMTATLEDLQAKPNDPDALINALASATQFQDEALFDKIAPFAQDDVENAKVQGFLGDAYSYFSRREEANEAYMHALRVDPTPQVYRSAAMNALRSGSPERAEELIEYVLADKVLEDVAFVQVIIEGYQTMGRHDEALALMDRRDDAFPDLADDKTLVKARKESEKYRTSNKRLKKTNLFDDGAVGAHQGGSFVSRAAKWAFPLLLVVAACAYFGFSYYKGANQTIYLVNGTDKSYTATVNGQTVILKPKAATTTTVPEGEVKVEAPGFAEVTGKIETNFWTRPFGTNIFVFNPDRLAVLYEEETLYSETPTTNPLPKVTFGKPFTEFTKPNHIFEEFPATIQLKKGQTQKRTRLAMLNTLTPIQFVGMVLKPEYESIKNETLIRLCNTYPDRDFYLTMASVLLPPTDYQTLLKAGLKERPLRVDWHFQYQRQQTTDDEREAVLAEYRKLHDELQTGDAKYLLATVLPEGPEKLKLFEDATTTNPPSAYGWFALATRKLSVAQPREALELAKKALDLKGQHTGFEMVYLDALWATGAFAEYRQELNRFPNSFVDKDLEMYRAACAEKNLEDQQYLRSQYLTPKPGLGLSIPERTRELDRTHALISGNVAGYLKATTPENANPGKNIATFYRALLAEDELDVAEGELDDFAAATQRVKMLGLLALAYKKAGNESKFKRYTEKLTEALRKSGPSDQAFADILSSETPFDAKKAINSPMNYANKSVVLCVLAKKFPQDAKALQTMAKKLDTQRDETSLVLKHLGY